MKVYSRSLKSEKMIIKGRQDKESQQHDCRGADKTECDALFAIPEMKGMMAISSTTGIP
jgi:hypothetical protein